MIQTIAIQSRFYFRFMLMLLLPEVAVGQLTSHQFLGFFTAAGGVVLIAALGVRFGVLRSFLAGWTNHWSANPNGAECKNLLSACKKEGKTSVHTNGFIEQFELAWRLPKSPKGRWFQAVIWFTTRAGMWYLIVVILSYFATEHPWAMPARISVAEKYTLATLMCTTFIVCETHRLGSQQGELSQARSYIFAVILLLTCIGAVSCEGLLHNVVGRPRISKIQLHFIHELVIWAIAFLMMAYEVLVEYGKKKRFFPLSYDIWIHTIILAVMLIDIFIEKNTGGWKHGQFLGLVGMQVAFHIFMHFKKGFLPPKSDPSGSGKAYAQVASG